MPRPRGRPPLSDTDTSVGVNLRIVAKDFDALCRLARERRQTLSECLRTEVKRAIRDPRDPRDP